MDTRPGSGLAERWCVCEPEETVGRDGFPTFSLHSIYNHNSPGVTPGGDGDGTERPDGVGSQAETAPRSKIEMATEEEPGGNNPIDGRTRPRPASSVRAGRCRLRRPSTA